MRSASREFCFLYQPLREDSFRLTRYSLFISIRYRYVITCFIENFRRKLEAIGFKHDFPDS